ncbi:trimethylamine N-oxide reductase system protein TorE [Psychromonas ossibalaenae]|uniref:trimethylamine N-oxide reductase system protein TorE n=1 Tax=Psychromonas ossibalaenae TaxID=444922 RepID=UPI00037B5D98|nr:trimethylamine N-oxide reductase system protein TorE [Psychromonas ossibalaenae]
MSEIKTESEQTTRAGEWKTFLFITVCLFPILSVMLVGGYGFSVWFLQMFMIGPPGHG